jgi:transposase
MPNRVVRIESRSRSTRLTERGGTEEPAATGPAKAKVPRRRLEIVKRSDDVKGFVALPRRWVVERTFSWFRRNRRLANNFENLTETVATFVTLASIQLALRRLPRA